MIVKSYIGVDRQVGGSSVVYWIRRPHYTDMFSQGYIGITSKPVMDRWYNHQRNNGHNGILRNALESAKDVVFEVVVVAPTREYCERLEQLLRPKEYIGWNICVGGGKMNSKLGGQTNRLRHIKLKLADANKACQLWWEAEKRLLKAQARQAKKQAKAEFVPHTRDRGLSKRNKIGLTGVSWYAPFSKWRAQIKLDGKSAKFLGYFDDPHEAHSVYMQYKAARIEQLKERAKIRKLNILET